MKTLRDSRIAQAQAAAREAGARAGRIVFDVQSRCTHESIVESESAEHDCGSEPPMRMCMHCGLCEAASGPGYQVLRTQHPVKMQRDEMVQFERTYLTDAERSDLRRNQTTLVALLAKKHGATVYETEDGYRIFELASGRCMIGSEADEASDSWDSRAQMIQMLGYEPNRIDVPPNGRACELSQVARQFFGPDS